MTAAVVGVSSIRAADAGVVLPGVMTPALPAGTVDSDVLVAFAFTTYGRDSPIAPAGWIRVFGGGYVSAPLSVWVAPDATVSRDFAAYGTGQTLGLIACRGVSTLAPAASGAADITERSPFSEPSGLTPSTDGIALYIATDLTFGSPIYLRVIPPDDAGWTDLVPLGDGYDDAGGYGYPGAAAALVVTAAATVITPNMNLALRNYAAYGKVVSFVLPLVETADPDPGPGPEPSANLLTYDAYVALSGDTTTASAAVVAAITEAETAVSEQIRRPLTLAERTEPCTVDIDGRVYPRAIPIASTRTGIVEGERTLSGVPLSATEVTYTAGWTPDTAPFTLLRVIGRATYTLTHGGPVRAADAQRTGDTSAQWPTGSGPGAARGRPTIEQLSPGATAELARWSR